MLGAATALMGERAAMACTEAIEEVIDRHYAERSAAFGVDEAELRELAVAQAVRDAPGSRLLTDAVKTSSRLAIWLSTRV